MPRKRVLRLGDVVEVSESSGEIRAGTKGVVVGTVTTEGRTVSVPKGGASEIIADGNILCQVKWLEIRKPSIRWARVLRRCKGMKNTSLCEQCRDRLQCVTTRGR